MSNATTQYQSQPFATTFELPCTADCQPSRPTLSTHSHSGGENVGGDQQVIYLLFIIILVEKDTLCQENK
jgi:hypothetical protein